MILVTVGTNEAAFDRLLRAVEGLGDDEPIVVQHGSSDVLPANAERCVDFLLFDDLVEEMRRSRVVVTHAGIGSIMSALASGKRPVVVPRLARHGEAVDDHQVPLARRLEGTGLVVVVEDLDLLRSAVRESAAAFEGDLRPDEQLVGELRDYIASRSRADGHSR